MAGVSGYAAPAPLLSSTFIIQALHSHSDFLLSPFHHTWLMPSAVLPSQFPLQRVILSPVAGFNSTNVGK